MPNEPCADDRLTRRSFLRVGGLSAVAWSLPSRQTEAAVDLPAPRFERAKACIFLLLTGGPSQLDTFDPKPDAPAEVRGPFGVVRTSVPGTWLSETLPRLAQRAHRYALVRTVHHDQLPMHETGLQLLLTGALQRMGQRRPSIPAALAFLEHQRRNAHRPWYILPRPLEPLGSALPRGQDAAPLDQFSPLCLDDLRNGVTSEPAALLAHAVRTEREPATVRDRYGPTDFGRHCLIARRLVERGARFVIVNMFTRVLNSPSWDCHANGFNLPTTVLECGQKICPVLDQALAALLDDLADRGLLDETLVVAAGEMGRGYMNRRGGRDHWIGTWSVLMAGAGIPGGVVVGKTDHHAMEPAETPVPLADLAATICWILGHSPQTAVHLPDGRAVPLTEGKPVAELVR